MAALISKTITEEQRTFLQRILKHSKYIAESDRVLCSNVIKHERYYEVNADNLNRIVKMYVSEHNQNII